MALVQRSKFELSNEAKLFEDLLHGRIDNPDEAERIAAEQGLGPLNPPPEKWVYDQSCPNRRPR